ncbi:MAG: 23S rRNA (guanosine(2251)-2'-O)-methyltransferase RlmB [Acidobacteria bacterium]|nr:MAG: 23S rRNA (guanosine(2251)-2'-O)-methyltransferase RlmB [Acidobacteriota bacterium]
MIIHGINAVTEALQDEKPTVEKILITRGRANARLQKIIDLARARGVPVQFQPQEALNRKAGSPRHQDVVAEMSAGTLASFEEILDTDPKLILLLDGVEDPRNLGAVLRTAEAAGAEAILLPRHHSCGITPAVVQVSAGAALHLKIAHIGNLVTTLEKLKKQDYWTVGLDMQGKNTVREIDPKLKLAVVIGGEHRGVRPLVRQHCDFLISLPMKGRVSSLNLSVAAGILLYQLLERGAVAR